MTSRILFSLNKILGQLVGRRDKQGLSMSESPKKGKGKVGDRIKTRRQGRGKCIGFGGAGASAGRQQGRGTGGER